MDLHPEFSKHFNYKLIFLVISVGDWNEVQDYNLDTINYFKENNPYSKLKLHSMIIDLEGTTSK